MFRFDTHIHTSETSSCSRLGAKQLVELYRSAGYQGFAVTDHFFEPYFESLGGIPWTQKVDCFLEGFERAREAGGPFDFHVILGIELRLSEGLDDYLVYGLTPQDLKELPDLYRMTFPQFRGAIRDTQTLVFLAHPFRGRRPLCPNRDIDGVEVYNGTPRHQNYNELALDYANMLNCYMISGSDCHQEVEVGRGGLLLQSPLENAADLVGLYRNNGTPQLIGEGIFCTQNL